MTLTLIRPADCIGMPWKNGAGITRQIAISPANATLENFDWRITSATVASVGPFSFFPGVDRSLAVISGGLELDAGAGRFSLAARDAPWRFRGECAVQCAPDATTIDFNVMTRRDRCQHQLSYHRVTGEFAVKAHTVLIFCLAGDIGCSGDHSLTAGPGCALRLADSEKLTLQADQARFFLVRILPVNAPP